MCITITGYTHNVNGRPYYKYTSSPAPSGAYAEGDIEILGRTLAQMVEISIVNTMNYLGIPRTEICGQECTPNWTGGVWSICQNNTQSRIETDGCGNTRTETRSCTPSSNNTLIYAGLAAAGLVIIYLSMKKK